ncbi:MAG: NAD(P)H-dependent oxidoreductase [Sandaracinaceae bacterium]|nr:NAD(P)H-dependent oxidoreductase [Sandaracinaceae bacterium]
MAVIRIVSISGSLQARSSNLSLVDSLSSLAGPEVEVTRWDGLRGLPHFDLDANEAPPPEVCAWRDALRAADGVLIATPEYGHSLPARSRTASTGSSARVSCTGSRSRSPRPARARGAGGAGSPRCIRRWAPSTRWCWGASPSRGGRARRRPHARC